VKFPEINSERMERSIQTSWMERLKSWVKCLNSSSHMELLERGRNPGTRWRNIRHRKIGIL